MKHTALIEKSLNAIKATLIFKTLSMSLGLAASVLIVRALSEMEFGIYSLLYTMISLLYMVASFGICDTLQRYIPEYYQRGEFIIAHNLYRTATFLRLIANTLILGLVLILWEQIAPVLKIAEYKQYFMLFTLVVFADMQRTMLDICLSSYFLQKYSKAIGCLFSGTRVLGYSLIIIFDLDLWIAITTDITAYLIVFTILQILYFRKIPTGRGKLRRFSQHERKRVMRYAFFYNFNDVGTGIMNSYFDNLIIAMYMSPVAVGAYTFCITMVVMIGKLLPIKYFKEIIQASFFSMGESSGAGNISQFFQSIVKINSIFTLPIFCFLLLYADDIILVVFDGKFADYALVLCAIFFFFEVIAFPFALIAQLKEKARVIFFSKIFALYNLAADIVLISHWGLWGAVIATGTAVLGKNLFIWYFIKEDAGFKGLEGFFTKLTLYWAVSVLLMHYLDFLTDVPLLKLLTGGVLFSLLFLFQFRLNLFNTVEKQTFKLMSKKNRRLAKMLIRLQVIDER